MTLYPSVYNVHVLQQSPVTLDYATPPTRPIASSSLRVGCFLFALFGIAFNLAVVAGTIRSLHRASWAYHDLMQDPKAYGREIDQTTIASLRQPIGLWTWEIALIVAATFGLWLAIDLGIAAALFGHRPDRAALRLRMYGRLKPIGAGATALAFLFAGAGEHWFWVAATRHWPIGSSEAPYLSTAILFACAWFPAWRIRARRALL